MACDWGMGSDRTEHILSVWGQLAQSDFILIAVWKSLYEKQTTRRKTLKIKLDWRASNFTAVTLRMQPYSTHFHMTYILLAAVQQNISTLRTSLPPFPFPSSNRSLSITTCAGHSHPPHRKLPSRVCSYGCRKPAHSSSPVATKRKMTDLRLYSHNNRAGREWMNTEEGLQAIARAGE